MDFSRFKNIKIYSIYDHHIDETYIDFTVDDIDFYLFVEKNGLKWKPINIVHDNSLQGMCPFCRAITSVNCETLEKNLDDVFEFLINSPSIRLRKIFNK